MDNNSSTPQGDFVSIHSIDYLEYAVKDLEASGKMFSSLGFVPRGRRRLPERESVLWTQGDIQIVLSASSSERDEVFRFTRAHGDGVFDIALTVPNAEQDLARAQKQGAQVLSTTSVEGVGGAPLRHRGQMATFGDVRHSFISYEKGASLVSFFPEGTQGPGSPGGRFAQVIDHVTVNVEKGRVEYWAAFYKRIFGFSEVRYFDIKTDKSGLFSRALRSPNGRVTMPINEPTNEKSQIQEFLNIFKGPGVQHVALHVTDIIAALTEYRAKGWKFLTVPSTYYDTVPQRVPQLQESLEVLKKLDILVDGSDRGYLLQIFSENVVGPFFFEMIQRRGDKGFGEGNFKALFEAIERDQMRRGVL